MRKKRILWVCLILLLVFCLFVLLRNTCIGTRQQILEILEVPVAQDSIEEIVVGERSLSATRIAAVFAFEALPETFLARCVPSEAAKASFIHSKISDTISIDSENQEFYQYFVSSDSKRFGSHSLPVYVMIWNAADKSTAVVYTSLDGLWFLI